MYFLNFLFVILEKFIILLRVPILKSYPLKYLSILLILSFINGCSLLGLGRNDWRDKYDIEPDTGVLVGKFDLAKDVKGKKFLCYLMDSTLNKIVAYDTLKENGIVLFKNLPAGKYYIDARESWPATHEGKLIRSIGGSPLTNENCEKVGVMLRENTITSASFLITYDKAAIRYFNMPDREMPIIKEDNEITERTAPSAPPEIKDECWLTPNYELLNDSTYTSYRNSVK